jgi:hypothetical protein
MGMGALSVYPLPLLLLPVPEAPKTWERQKGRGREGAIHPSTFPTLQQKAELRTAAEEEAIEIGDKSPASRGKIGKEEC